MDIQKLIGDYLTWLKSEIKFEKCGEHYEITVPYMNCENDYLQIYVWQQGDYIYLSDDCATIHDIKMSGIRFTLKQKIQLQKILSQYGIEKKGDELTAKCPVNKFAQKKYMFIQAMLKIDSMFNFSKP